jgi:hypothetical protein
MEPVHSERASALETASQLAASLVALGTAWLRYGLAVGESSLKTSAHTLESTARLFAEVADRLRADAA